MWMAHNRMGIDFRLLGWSALIRSGQMSREEALDQIPFKPIVSQATLNSVLVRLGFTEDAFRSALAQPVKTHKDFKTYKRTFERLRPRFWLLMRQGKVPQSFYLKYCKPED
jgi:hypothetical protein